MAYDDGTQIRLQKVLAAAGIGSRRACEQLIDEGDLPTGESLAAELTRFLRDRESDGPPPAG